MEDKSLIRVQFKREQERRNWRLSTDDLRCCEVFLVETSSWREMQWSWRSMESNEGFVFQDGEITACVYADGKNPVERKRLMM